MGANAYSTALAMGLALSILAIGCTPQPKPPAGGPPPGPAAAPDTVRVGKAAPTFTLKDQDGKDFSLQALRGQWVVLYFFPKAGTPGCTIEACDFSEGIDAFKGLHAVVVGCSPDSPADLKQFEKDKKLKVRLLSDPAKQVMARYLAFQGEDPWTGKGAVVRSTVLIDPRGVVRQHWSKVTPKGHAEEVREKLSQYTGST